MRVLSSNQLSTTTVRPLSPIPARGRERGRERGSIISRPQTYSMSARTVRNSGSCRQIEIGGAAGGQLGLVSRMRSRGRGGDRVSTRASTSESGRDPLSHSHSNAREEVEKYLSGVFEGKGVTLSKLELVCVIGTFSISLIHVARLIRELQKERLKEKESKLAPVNLYFKDRESKVVKIEAIEQPSSRTSTIPSCFIQLQVLGLSVAYLCSFLTKRSKGFEEERRAKQKARRSGDSVVASLNSGDEIEIWKAISRANRQLSKNAVKQRITRRALEQQMDSIGQKNTATNEALVAYSKEFKKLQSEVVQVYSVVASLEKATRSQLHLISKLVEEKSDAPLTRGESSPPGSAPQPEEASANHLQRTLHKQMNKSSTFRDPVICSSNEGEGEDLVGSTEIKSKPEEDQGPAANHLQKAVHEQMKKSSSFQENESGTKGGVKVERSDDWSIYHFE